PRMADADNSARVGVDVGGTFTDVILQHADGRAMIRKLLSTPPNYDVAVVMLRVQKVKALSPAGYTAAGWDVADIRKAIEQLSAKGVRFERYEGLPQDACGIWT